MEEHISNPSDFLNLSECLQNIKLAVKDNLELKYLVVVLEALIALVNEKNIQYRSVISSHFSAVRHCIRFYLGRCALSESLTPFIVPIEKVLSPEVSQREGSALDNLADDLEQEKRMQKEQEYLDTLSTEQHENALKKFLFDCWAQLIYNKRPSKKFFISYAWPKPHDDFHDESHVIGYLFKLVEHFIQSGMQVCIDQFHSGAGKSLGKFMGKIDEVVLPEGDAYEVDHVLVVSTRTLLGKLSNSGSGCSCEHRNMRARIEKERKHRFIIPILLNRVNYLPLDFKKIVSINFCTTSYLENFKELFRVTNTLGKSFLDFCDERICVYGLGLDVCIASGLKEKYTSPEVANIELLTYTNSTPLLEGFVDLAVVKDEEYQERERLQQRSAEENAQDKPLPTIALNKMGETDVGHTLVEGPAGVGKSTLMRYFANQWAQNSVARNLPWLAQYDAVVLLPLRRLHEYDEAIELAEFVLQECISADYQEKLSRDMIQKYLLDNPKVKILYLLDGLDEVGSLLIDGCHGKLLQLLLKKKYWVMTSRPPCQVDKAKLGAVRHLQNVGFVARDVEKYIKQFFKGQETKVGVLMRMLENNTCIRGIANVPINLEFLCTIVQSEEEQSQEDIVNMTVTQLYEKVLVLLLRRYLLRLQELKVLPARPNILNLTSSRILSHPKCQAPLKFLQELAWLAFQQKTFLVNANTIQKTSKKYFTGDDIDQDIDNLFTHLFLLKPTGKVAKSALDQNYYFVHATFLEFFVAQRVFNGLLDKESLETDIQALNLLQMPINQRLITQETQVLQFLAEMLKGKEKRIKRLQEVVLASRSQILGKKACVAASNALTILNVANVSLHNQDFVGVQVGDANLFGAMLWGSNCKDADFTGANLAGACLQDVDISGAKMRGVNFGEWPYIQLERKFNHSVFSKGGKYLALAVENEVEIYETETGKRVKTLKGHTNRICCIAFDNSGKQFATGSFSAEVFVWDITSGKVEKSFDGHKEKITCLTFDQTGEKLAASSLDNTVIIWNAKTSRKICNFRGHIGVITSLLFHPLVEQLISASDDGTVRCWDSKTGKEPKVSVQPSVSNADSVFLDTGEQLKRMPIPADADYGYRLFSLSRERAHKLFSENLNSVRDILKPLVETALCADENFINYLPDDFLAVRESYYLFRDARQEQDIALEEYGRTLKQYAEDLNLLSCYVDYDIRDKQVNAGWAHPLILYALAHINKSSHFYFWELDEQGKMFPHPQIPRHNPRETFLAVDLLFVRGNRFEHLQKVSIPQMAERFQAKRLPKQNHGITCLAFDANFQKLAVSTKDGCIRLWDLYKCEELACLRGHEGVVHSIRFDESGGKLVSSGDDGTVRLWGIFTKTELQVYRGHSEGVSNVVFDMYAQRVVSVDVVACIRFWSLQNSSNPKLQCSIPGKSRTIAINARANVVSTAENNTVRFWCLTSGKELNNIKKLMTITHSLSFDVLGRRVALANHRVISIVDVMSGKELQRFARKKRWIKSAVFELDDEKMFLASKDDTARLWDLRKQEELFCVGTDANNHRVAMSAKGECFAYVDEAGFLSVRNLRGEISRLPYSKGDSKSEYKPQFACIHFDGLGKKLIAGDKKGNIWLWNIAPYNLLLHLSHPSHTVSQVIFNPQGDKFLFVSSDQFLRFYDVATGTCLLVLELSEPIFSVAWESVENENIVVVNYGKNLASYVENTSETNFSLTLKWATTEKKLILQGVRVDETSDLDSRNRSLIAQQAKLKERGVGLSGPLKEIEGTQSANEAIILSVRSKKKGIFHRVNDAEAYQPVILVYDVLKESDLLLVFNSLGCVEKNKELFMWDWRCWPNEDGSFLFKKSYNTYRDPLLLGYISIVDRRCYVVLPSFKRACLALRFFYESFKGIAKVHGALLVNALFAANELCRLDFGKFLEHIDITLDEKIFAREDNGRPLSLVKYYRFNSLEETHDPKTSYLDFEKFLEVQAREVMAGWIGQAGYKLDDVVKFWAQRTTEQKQAVTTDEAGDSPLHIIAKNGDLSAFEPLLSSWVENGENVVDKLNAKNKKGETALHWAAMRGYKDLCALLLDLGAALDVFDEHQLSPMQGAIRENKEEIVELFLERGARVDEKNEEWSIGIQSAAAEGHVRLVEKFIQKKLDDPKRKTSFGRTALHLAAREGHSEVVSLLLEYEHFINDPCTQFGNAPLHYAAANGHVVIVNILLAMGASCSVENNARQTPQQLAAVCDQAEVFEVFCGATGIDTRIQFYQVRLQFNPTSPHDHIKLARCYAIKAQQEPHNAARLLGYVEIHLLAAIESPTWTAVAFVEYGNYLVRSGCIAEAVPQLLRVVELEDQDSTITYDLLERCLLEEDLQEKNTWQLNIPSDKRLYKLLEKDLPSQQKITLNNRLYALRLLTLCYLQLDKRSEAEALLYLFYELAETENNKISYLLVSWTLRDLGKFDQAKKYLRYAEASKPDSELELECILPLLNVLVKKMESFDNTEAKVEEEYSSEDEHEKENDPIFKRMVPFGSYKSKMLNRGAYKTVDTGQAYLPIMVGYTVFDHDQLVAVLSSLKCCKRKGAALVWSWFWREECEELKFAGTKYARDKKRPLLLGEFSFHDNVLYLTFPAFYRAALAIDFLQPFFDTITKPSFLFFVNRAFALRDEVSTEYEDYFVRYRSGEALPDSISYYEHNPLGVELPMLINMCGVVVEQNWTNNQALSLQSFFDFSDTLAKINLLFNHLPTLLYNNQELIRRYYVALIDGKLPQKTSREDIAFYEEKILIVEPINNLMREIEENFNALQRRVKEYENFSNIGYLIFFQGLRLITEGVKKRINYVRRDCPASLVRDHYYNLACARFAAASDENDGVLLAKAEVTFQHAIALEEDAGICTEYGLLLLKCEKYSEVITYLKKAIALRSTEEDVSYGKRERNTLPKDIQLLIDEQGEVSLRADIFAYYLLGICCIELNQPSDFLDLFPAFEKEILQSESYFHCLLYSYTCRQYGLHDKVASYSECAAKLKPAAPALKSSSPVESLMASKTSLWEEPAIEAAASEEDEELRLAIELSLQSEKPGL